MFRGFWGHVPYNHHHLRWQTGGLVVIICLELMYLQPHPVKNKQNTKRKSDHLPTIHFPVLLLLVPRRVTLITNMFRYLKWRNPHLCKQYVRPKGKSTPKIAENTLQETLHFRYLKFLVIDYKGIHPIGSIITQLAVYITYILPSRYMYNFRYRKFLAPLWSMVVSGSPKRW